MEQENKQILEENLQVESLFLTELCKLIGVIDEKKDQFIKEIEEVRLSYIPFLRSKKQIDEDMVVLYAIHDECVYLWWNMNSIKKSNTKKLEFLLNKLPENILNDLKKQANVIYFPNPPCSSIPLCEDDQSCEEAKKIYDYKNMLLENQKIVYEFKENMKTWAGSKDNKKLAELLQNKTFQKNTIEAISCLVQKGFSLKEKGRKRKNIKISKSYPIELMPNITERKKEVLYVELFPEENLFKYEFYDYHNRLNRGIFNRKELPCLECETTNSLSLDVLKKLARSIFEILLKKGDIKRDNDTHGPVFYFEDSEKKHGRPEHFNEWKLCLDLIPIYYKATGKEWCKGKEFRIFVEKIFKKINIENVKPSYLIRKIIESEKKEYIVLYVPNFKHIENLEIQKITDDYCFNVSYVILISKQEQKACFFSMGEYRKNNNGEIFTVNVPGEFKKIIEEFDTKEPMLVDYLEILYLPLFEYKSYKSTEDDCFITIIEFPKDNFKVRLKNNLDKCTDIPSCKNNKKLCEMRKKNVCQKYMIKWNSKLISCIESDLDYEPEELRKKLSKICPTTIAKLMKSLTHEASSQLDERPAFIIPIGF